MISVLLGDGFQSNAYLVRGERCCVIDPGVEPERVLKHIRDYNIRLDLLINTHCHFDHVGANPGILSNGKIAALCHGYDAPALERGDESMQLSGLFGMAPVKHAVDRPLADGDIVDLGGVTLEVLHTPGHTPGSICLLEPVSRSLFAGDTVFAGSVGRCDFKGGSAEDLESSVRRLAEISDARGIEKVYPGHGLSFGGDGIREVLELYF